jgi:hypothetical protein
VRAEAAGNSVFPRREAERRSQACAPVASDQTSNPLERAHDGQHSEGTNQGHQLMASLRISSVRRKLRVREAGTEQMCRTADLRCRSRCGSLVRSSRLPYGSR